MSGRRVKHAFGQALNFRLLLVLMLMSAFVATPSFAAVTYRSAAQASSSGTAIAFRAAGGVQSAGSGNISPGLPAGTAVGDLLIAVVEAKDNVALSMAGWNLLFNQNGGVATHQAAIFWRIATTGDPTAITHTGGNAILARIMGFSGVDTTNPFETLPLVAGNAAFAASSTTTTSGTQTTTNATAMLVFTAHYGDDYAGTPTGPAGFTNPILNETTTGTDAAIAAFYQAQATAGAKGPVTFNWASGGATTAAPTHGVLFALRPASSTLRIDKPANTVSGDVMIASVAVAPTTAAIAAPVGWTLIRQVPQAGANTSTLATYYRVAGTGEPANYAWGLSAHSGAVGGIMSFSGVDDSAPIDAELGVATNSALTHAAPSVTTGQNDGMLVTVHELASAATWTPPGTMAEVVDVASLTPNNANGISIQMNYEARPTLGATGARTATASANADRGATQSVSLRPLPLICYTDDFTGADNSPLSADWVSSSISGGFGAPRIFANRLRLTNASASVSTMASLQRLFPGAGNRIEIEFDHFAYGGNGADGIGVVLSNGSVTPVPGAFGGSLGYAQKSNPGSDCTVPGGCPGFAGGWLGVGVDEFGNFSNPTEGRSGGPAQRADSVSVRGSGSGQTGYIYHTGTATLAPGIDVAGATPAPGYRYRIIVDHSSSAAAFVSVERSTGAGYNMLIAPYDAKAQAGQAAVPTNWLLSYTGSTGGLNNIHEIDNLRVCAATQTPISGIHHFEITVSPSASTCASQDITIVAKDASNITLTGYTGAVSITTSTSHGDWGAPAVNGTADDGAAQYTFVAANNGSITLPFTNTHADDLTINVTDVSAPSSSTTSEAISFRDSAFVITPNPIKIAGRPQAMTVALYTRVGGSCSPDANYDGAKNLDGWITRDAADPGGAAPSINGVTLPNAAPASNPGSNNLPGITFTNGVASINLDTTDVGRYVLSLRDDTRLYATAIDLGGASSSLTTGPWLHVAVPGNPGASAAGGSAFTSAGTNFSATVRGVVWQAADDANNDGVPDAGANLSNNAVTPSFAWTTALTATTPFTPATPSDFPAGAGATGALDRAPPTGGNTIAQGGFSGGSATVNDWRYSEVGSFTLLASASNFLNSGTTFSTRNGVVGRFIPAYFQTGLSMHGCAPATFTYSGQPFTVTATAYNGAGAPTANYDGTLGFAKDVTLSNAGTTHPGTFSNNTIAAANFAGGTRTQPNVAYTFTAKETVPLTLTGGLILRATETSADGVTSAGHTEQSTEVRSGRLLIQNAFGSELADLAMPMRVQYYGAGGWMTNGDDRCTTVTLAFSNYQGGNLVAGDTCVQDSGAPGLSGQGCAAAGPGSEQFRESGAPGYNGDFNLYLRKPAGGHVGSVQVSSDLALMPWLRDNWDGAGGDDDPTGRATFGIYKGSPRHIYLRERY